MISSHLVIASAGLIGITTVLILGTTPASAQRMDCYRQENVIQCPGYGNFPYDNSGDYPNQIQIEVSIRDMYLQVFGRTADTNGLRVYSDAVRNRRLSLNQVRRELVNSPEGDRSIRRYYQQAYGRNPNDDQFRNARRSIENGLSIRQLRQ